MAVSNFSGLTISNPQVGIQITKVTDSSADWPSVANSTYFYDKTDNLVHYKDSTGTVLEIFSASNSSFIPQPDSMEVFRGRTFRYDSTTVDTYAGIATLNNASALGATTSTSAFYNRFVRLRYYASVVSTGRQTDIRGTDLQWTLSGGFRFVTTFRVADTAFGSTCQQFYGMAGYTTQLPYGGASVIQLENLVNLIGVGSNGTDTNLHVYHNDASGTCTKVDLGASFPANRTAGSEMTTMYSIELYNEVNTSTVKYEVINLETGAVAQGTVSTNLPATTQGLTIFASRCMGGGGGNTNSGQFEVHKWGCFDIIR